MLVLSRKKNQTLVVTVPANQREAVDIRVMVTDIKGKIVRLGIDAPVAVPVKRGEMLEIRGETLAD